MSSFLIALLVALGASTWIYTKMMKTSGGLTKNAITVAAVCGVIILIFVFSIANILQ